MQIYDVTLPVHPHMMTFHKDPGASDLPRA